MIIADDHVAVRKREGRDIWQGLHEFLLIEKSKRVKKEIILEELKNLSGLGNFKITRSLNSDQKLTHQLIHFNLYCIETDEIKPLNGLTWVPQEDIHEFAFPKTLQLFIKSGK
jgi:A/G-specific adenine glycosylase